MDASAIHLAIFGMHPVVRHGSEAMRRKYLPSVAKGDLHVAFGVTEPDAGTDSTNISTFARRDGDRYLVECALDGPDFAGEGTLYGGYALRTRTKNNGFAVHGAYIVSGDEVRGESHFPAPDFRTSTVRWLRSDDTPKVARVLPAFVLKGEKTTLTVEGLNLPDANTRPIRPVRRGCNGNGSGSKNKY